MLSELVVYDLCKDYSRLHCAIVANSNAWYHYWINEEYAKENMSYLFAMLQKNTEESLWQKCLEDYEDFHPIQRGGPLMLFLILKQIQNTSEAAMESLKTQVRRFKISSITGEDVDVVVSLIKSTYKILSGASTAEHSFIPDDFNHTVIKVFQTTSVREFNANFKEIERKVLSQADMSGMAPEWPSVTHLVNRATNSFSRMKVDKKWHNETKRVPALNVTDRPQQRKHCCFNCQKDHLLPDCPEPRDEARIAKNRAAYKKANPNPHTKKRTPRTKEYGRTADGKPTIKNKLGTYVLDQKRLKEEKEINSLIDALSPSETVSAPTPSPSPSPAPAPAPTPSTESTPTTNAARVSQRTATIERVRTLLLRR